MQELTCPGCRSDLESIAESGRADDLYLCPNCYHSWFAFELDGVQSTAEGGTEPEQT